MDEGFYRLERNPNRKWWQFWKRRWISTGTLQDWKVLDG